MRRIVTMIIMMLGSLVADLSLRGFFHFKKSPSVDYQLQEYLAMTDQIPVGAIFFGFFFSISCSFALRGRARVGFEEIMGCILLFPLARFLLGYLPVFLGGPLAAMGVPLVPLNYGLYSLFLAIIVNGLFSTKLGGFKVFTVGLIGVGLYYSSLYLNLPFSPVNMYYLSIGTVLAYFLSGVEVYAVEQRLMQGY